MLINQCIACLDFPCLDVRHENYYIPPIEVAPEKISMIMLSEASPENLEDHYYAADKPLFQQTTLQAFHSAGVQVGSFSELLAMGIYFTTAVKCGKIGYGIKTATIKNCSVLLAKELALFPAVKAILLMGDVAIKAINAMSRREGAGRAIPVGATYKIRGGDFYFRGMRVFPSYLQVGPSFGIEKSKQRMIGEDIAAALKLWR
jgi:hypothetical protein